MNTVRFENKDIIPSKILCVGRNYVEHVNELGNEIPDEMVIFSKPNSAISQTLQSTHLGESLHYEGEICFLFSGGEFSAVGFGLDLTKRESQSRLKKKGLPWERAKAFDGAALFSEFVPFSDLNEEFAIELTLNGARQQHGTTTQMMFKPLDILNELSRFMTLEDGDIVMTGTPAGVGIVKTDDVFRGSIICNNREIVSEVWEAKA